MVSKLREIVAEVAEENDLKIEKWQMENLKLPEVHLDRSGDIDAAMADLKKIFDYKWKKKAYPQIEKLLNEKK